MDVFALRDAVVGEYENFATSFTTIKAEDIDRQVQEIYAGGKYWPEPLVQINPNYRPGHTVEKLAADGDLEPLCADIFRTVPSAEHPRGETLRLHMHQEQAIALAALGKSYVVTTGTGSGKSLCFFIPIVNAVLAERRRGGPRRTRAIVIYPMNALANSQLEELEKYVAHVQSADPPVTFARYTGQEKTEVRQKIAADPPEILLTNFMMLELLMTRQDEIDQKVIGNCEGLQFLVLDELHTYRGRQGADVALLVRRVRERLSPERLQCIGTSATMASEGTLEEKSRVVARVASKLFAAEIPASNVVVERLERVTDPATTREAVRPLLGAAIDAGIPADITDAALRVHPLAVWVETTLGITFSQADQQWVRAQPLTLTEAVERLSADAGRPAESCRAALRSLLLSSSVPESERTGNPHGGSRSFFAFKLHQFISGAGHAYATLEAPGKRTVTVEGQQFLPGAPDKRLYAVHFCRECGQEYHPVRAEQDGARTTYLPRDIDDAPPRRDENDEQAEGADGDSESTTFGFLAVHPADADFEFADDLSYYPDAWLEQDKSNNSRLKSYYRPRRVREVQVTPDGMADAGIRAWFIPGRFGFCLRCKNVQSGATRDRNRLASLSAEGRSSATTVLVGSVLRWMHGGEAGLEPYKRKLLGFTDNRQDAALQSGHFNDFLFVSLVRAGFLGALQAAGSEGIRSDALGLAQQAALGFDAKNTQNRAEWLLEPSLKGANFTDAETTLRQVLTYRVWFDQRRGWRYTNPNLEALGLVEVEYLGLAELAADEEHFAGSHAILRNATPAVRAEAFRVLFDHLRHWMAIRSKVLDPTVTEQMLARSHNRLRAPWGFGADEKPRRARWLMTDSPRRRGANLRDEDLIVRAGSRSALAKLLRDPELWNRSTAVRDLKPAQFDTFIKDMLRAASHAYGLVIETATPFEGVSGWQLVDDVVLFRAGGGRAAGQGTRENRFFEDYYRSLATMLRKPGHPLFGFEAREHTAQVEQDKRQIREKRFRYEEKERQELAGKEQEVREIGETTRFLPVLFCSPTMELGVDISALNAVYLRNIPPTPANYAQRSGRAGRSGQAALVLTYCSALGPHDQYFFREPKAMVHGSVRAPLLDLANRDLVESHLQAVWLAATREALDPSISELLVLADPKRPVKPEIITRMSAEGVRAEATARIERVLVSLGDDLTPEAAPWFPGRAEFARAVVSEAPRNFEKAFNRWRELLLAAEQQREAARKVMDDYSAPAADKQAANSRHAQSVQQIDLLQKGTSTQSSDFYTYRYLATEGFLPGYNFPRLPLMAFVPANENARGRQTYLQRPRFLALSEFGPRSLVYHEGRAYRVVRALLSVGRRGSAPAEAKLATRAVRVCSQCGAGHFDDEASVCRGCKEELGDAMHIRDTFRIENVATQPAERITANDEERQRQGFDLQTTFEWAERDHGPDVRRGSARDDQGEVLELAYGPGATITRLNKGLRRRAVKTQLGFPIDPVSGYWGRGDDEEPAEGPSDPSRAATQWIVPCVQDRKNALLVRHVEAGFSPATQLTLEHALLRGIEIVFQLEEGEVLAEPMPSRDDPKGFLLYEATEGGAGVLTRLVAEPGTLARVAREALRIMHFAVPEDAPLPETPAGLSDVPGTACVAACYRCLMSYYNQPDHELLDRRDEQARALLLRLARAATAVVDTRPSTRPPVASDPGAEASTDPLGRWRARAAARGIPQPDPEGRVIDDVRVPLVWAGQWVAAVLDGVPASARERLKNEGYEVIEFGESDASWDAAFERLATELGVGS